MYCKKCGAVLADNQKFCSECGTPIGAFETNQSNRQAQGQMKTEPVRMGQNGMGNVGNYYFNGAVNTPKKQKSNKSAIIAVVAVVVAVALLLTAVVTLLIPMLKTALMSEEEKVAMHDRELVQSGLDVISQATEGFEKNTSGSGKISISVSDTLKEQFEDILGNIGVVSIGFDSALADGKSGFRLNLKLDDAELVEANIVIDPVTGKLYIEAPGLADGAFEIDLNTVMAENTLIESIPTSFSLPKLDKGTVSDILKLVDVFYDALDDVKETKGTLRVDGMAQNCTILTVEINGEKMSSMLIALLEQVKKSDNLKNFIYTVLVDFDDLVDFEVTNGNVSKEIDNAVDSLLSDLREADDFGEETLTYEMYIGSGREVVGRIISFEGTAIRMLKAKNGKEAAFEYSIKSEYDSVEFSGKGTEDKNGFTGNAGLYVDGDEILKLVLDGVSADSKKQTVKGKIEISAGKKLGEAAGLEDNTASGIGGIGGVAASALTTMKIKLDLDVSSDRSKVDINISAVNMDICSITLESEGKSDYKPQIPEGEKYNMLADFAAGIDIDELTKRLSDAGIDIGSIIAGLLQGAY